MPPTTDQTPSPTVTAAPAPWWRSAVVYQIYPQSFADSNGDGVGDIRGIIRKLDYLSALGADVLWICPMYPSPRDDNGYDISDYENIDPIYGTLEDFDQLLEQVHARGMKLIMDLVVNHTSDEHPWFIESRSSLDNPKRDWYWWRPARPGMEPGAPGAEPTNWESAFSGSAWELDPLTGEYYLHLFSRKQPDLNWENPDVRRAVYASMAWWMDRGIDGFRMDVINFISKDPALPDGPVLGDTPFARGAYICGPRIHEFLAEMHREVFGSRDGHFLTVGEMPGVTVDDARLFTDPARAEVDMVFQFEHVGLDRGEVRWETRPLRLTDLKASFGRWQAGLAETGWNSLYWNNHDQPRTVSRFGDDAGYRVESATMLATVLHLHRGTPYIYQGDELGMRNYPFSRIEEFQDISARNLYRAATAASADPAAVVAGLRHIGRDNARTPFQWDAGLNAGFSTGVPWLPVNPDYPTVNAVAEEADPNSVLHYFRKLIALRHTEPVVAHGDFTMLLPHHEQIYAFVRRWQGVELLVLGNFSADQQRIDPADIPDAEAWARAPVILGNYAEAPEPLGLRPWEASIHRRTVV